MPATSGKALFDNFRNMKNAAQWAVPYAGAAALSAPAYALGALKYGVPEIQKGYEQGGFSGAMGGLNNAARKVPGIGNASVDLMELAEQYARDQGASGPGMFAVDMMSPDPMGKIGALASAAGPVAKAIGGMNLAAIPAIARKADADMLVQHNLTGGNLLHADEMGGLSMPSIAITRPEHPFSSYGEVSLLGDPEMAKPSAKNPVFSADAYTSRYPTVHTMTSSADMGRLQESLAEPFGQSSLYRAPRDANGRDYVYFEPESNLQDVGVDRFLEHDAVKARFLYERGELPDVSTQPDKFEWQSQVTERLEANRAEFEKWKVGYLDRTGVVPERKIFKGYTNAGNRRYQSETAENVVLEMKKEMRGADGGASIYGSGALRSYFAPQFRTMKQIREARDRIQSPETVEVYKDAMNEKMSDVSARLADHLKHKPDNPLIANDAAVENMAEVMQGKASWDEWFSGVPEDLKAEAFEFVEELKNGPTGYFEMKPKRVVQLSEFNTALVPEDVDPKVIEALERSGVRIEKYSDEADRARRIAEQRNLMFSHLAPMLLGGGVVGAAIGGLLNEQPTDEISY